MRALRKVQGASPARLASRGVLLAIALGVGVVIAVLVLRIIALGPSFFVQILVFGVVDGAIYALVALGYTMVYGIIELINFAHGDVFTLGAFLSLPLLGALGLNEGKAGSVGLALGLLAVFLVVMVLTGLTNVVIERLAYRPLRDAPRLAPLITAVGVSFILEGLMFLWRGPYNIHYPDLLPSLRIPLGGRASVSGKDLFVVFTTLILVIALTLFINRSKLGKAMRATAQDRDAALLMGININRTISATFFIGAVLAGAGGIIFGLYFNNVDPFLGFTAGLFAFTAAVFGGIGNIQGAALGGMVIGIARALTDGYFSSAWSDVVIFSILILVLVFRPTGLLGMRVPER